MPEAFQLLVLFDQFPQINAEALRDYVSSLEADEEDACEASDFSMKATENGSVSSGVLSCGDLNIAIQIHGTSAPDQTLRGTIDIAPLPEAMRQKLRNHRVYAQCTALGGDEYHPVEGMILLLKVAMGLVAQGGTGVLNEHNCTCIPAQIAKAFADQARSDAADRNATDSDEDDEEEFNQTLWDSLREEGLPGELLVGFLPAEVEGEMWFLSAGHAMFGLPDLAYRAEDLSEVEEVDEHFKNIFYYMFENGPLLSAGHTMGYDENIAFRFHELPENRRELEGPNGTLVVTIEQAQDEIPEE